MLITFHGQQSKSPKNRITINNNNQPNEIVLQAVNILNELTFLYTYNTLYTLAYLRFMFCQLKFSCIVAL